MVKTRSEKTPAAPKGKEAIAAQARRLGLGQTVLSVLLLGGLWWVWENQLVNRLGLNKIHVHSIGDRLAFTLRHQLPSVVIVVLSLLHVSLLRLSSLAINPLSGNEHHVEKASRILQNTVEQFLLTLVNQLILATHLPESHLKLIPLITVSFVLGRVLFTAGYLRAPVYRTLGFNLTFLPTLAAVGYNIYFTWTNGYHHHLGGGVAGGRA
jgi:hypothetical protein